MESDVVPSPKRAGRVAMVVSEAGGKIGGLKFDFGGDAGNTEVLDKNMRREEDEAAEMIVSAGVDEGDGSAVAMTDEDGTVDLELTKEIGKRFERFVVHVGDGARFGEEIGVAGAVA